MIKLSRGAAWALVIGVVASFASRARAADDESAFQKHYTTAGDAYEAGRNARKFGDSDQAATQFRLAIEEYKLAYAASPHASKALYGAAQAYRALGDLEHALHLYEEYLKQDPNGAYAPAARALVPGLREQVARKAATTVAPPTGAPPNSEQTPHAATTPNPVKPPVEAGTQTPSRSSTAQTTVIVTPQPNTAPRAPVYKRAWFWGVVGGAAVVVALGVGLGVGLTQSSTNWPSQNTTLGAFKW